MITWVTIIAGIGCVLWALQQFRMTLIYMGVLHSPVIGQLAGPQPALIRTALLDALKYAGFALVFFVVSWPAFVTYLLVVMFVKSLLDFFLAVFHIGRFGSVQLTAKGRAHTAALELVPCAFYLVAVVISGYCLGWCARWGSRVGPSPPKPYLYRSEEGS